MATRPGKQNPLNQIVGSGLKATTPGSLISASFKLDPKSFSAGAGTKLRSGDELRLRQRGKSVFAEVLSRGRVTNRQPSGRFTLADGKTMVIEKGKVVGGDVIDAGKFLMFALLTDWPAERTKAG
jgi:hypothetical protein